MIWQDKFFTCCNTLLNEQIIMILQGVFCTKMVKILVFCVACRAFKLHYHTTHSDERLIVLTNVQYASFHMHVRYAAEDVVERHTDR